MARLKSTRAHSDVPGCSAVDELDDGRPEAVRCVQPREMAGSGDDLELRNPFGQCTDNLFGRGDRCHGVQLTDADQCRRVDTAELIDDIEVEHELAPVLVELKILGGTLLSLLVRDEAKGGIDPSRLLDGHLLVAVVTPCELSDLVAGDAAEALDHPRRVPPREPSVDNESGRVSGMARPAE